MSTTTTAGDHSDDLAEYHWFVQRHKTGVLASHAFQSASPAVPDTAAQPAPGTGGSE